MSKNLKNIIKKVLRESHDMEWFSDMNIDKIKVGAEFKSSAYTLGFIIDKIHWNEERPMDSIIDIDSTIINKTANTIAIVIPKALRYLFMFISPLLLVCDTTITFNIPPKHRRVVHVQVRISPPQIVSEV